MMVFCLVGLGFRQGIHSFFGDFFFKFVYIYLAYFFLFNNEIYLNTIEIFITFFSFGGHWTFSFFKSMMISRNTVITHGIFS